MPYKVINTRVCRAFFVFALAVPAVILLAAVGSRLI